MVDNSENDDVINEEQMSGATKGFQTEPKRVERDVVKKKKKESMRKKRKEKENEEKKKEEKEKEEKMMKMKKDKRLIRPRREMYVFHLAGIRYNFHGREKIMSNSH
ncbi:hypothetical protein ACLB2K_061382 [Fragaria x ananassa]